VRFYPLAFCLVVASQHFILVGASHLPADFCAGGMFESLALVRRRSGATPEKKCPVRGSKAKR
jgi:hypothetical protein